MFKRIEKEGLMVNISLLSSVILIGTGSKSDTIRIEINEKIGGGNTFFSQVTDLEIPDKYAALKSVVKRIFMKYHYTVLQKEDVRRFLSFQAEVPTLLREPHEYLVWDAIFYWEDELPL